MSTATSTLEDLLQIDGVVTADKFAADGRLLDFHYKELFAALIGSR